MSKNSLKYSVFLKTIFSLTLLGIIIYNIKILELKEDFIGFRPLILIIPFSLIFLIRIIQYALNYYILGLVLKIKLSFREWVKSVFFCWSVGYVSFGKVAEFGVLYDLKRKGVPIAKSGAIFLLDKIITLISLLALFPLAVIFLFRDKMIIIITPLGLGVLILMLFCLKNENIRNWIRNRIMGKYQEHFSGFYRFLIELIKCKIAIVFNAFNTILRLLSYGLTSFILLKGFGEDISLLAITGVNIINQVVTMIPISIANLGVQEAWYIIALKQYGVTAETALSFSITGRGISLLLISLFVPYFTLSLRLKRRK